jgi:hypothetical protein
MPRPPSRDILDAFAESVRDEVSAYLRATHPGSRVYSDVNWIPTYGANGHEFEGSFTIETPTGRRSVRFIRNFDWDTGTAYHEYFAMSEELQSRGISPYVQRKFLDFYDRVGIRRIETEANMEVGGYVWKQYGFRASDFDMSRLTGTPYDDTLKLLEAWKAASKEQLLGTAWEGHMELKDPAQRKVYEDYIRKQGARSELYKSVYGDPTPVAPKPPRAAPPPKPRFSKVLGVDRMEALLQASDRRIRRSFTTVIGQLKGELDINELADLITAGRMEEAISRLDDAGRALGAAANKEYIAAAEEAADFLRGAGVGRIQFNQVNTRAVSAMQRNTLRLVSNFSAEQAAATRAAITQGIMDGANPRDVARRFRDSIGLTQRQQAAVDNYRRLLGRAGTDARDQAEALTRELRDGRFDPSIRRAIREAVPLSPEQVDRMVGRYAERYVKYRSEVIARTEGLRSVHEGVEELFEQAFEEGVVGRDELIRTWDSSRDGRVRDSHKGLHGLQRAFGESFPGAAGPIRYPGDPEAPGSETIQCRCLLTTRLKPTKG